ncbi:uncharacterized protein JCM6883_004194 [Sporobolomyces salmoneus]|uniref:uncharacterized protein n=1 Tax=Sporobolomyces salmoneus TaxID=183962 RepID=UPI003175E026
MASTLVGAPVSKGLILTTCGCSILAAVTTLQHYFNVPFYGHPHIFRDHQFWRFATRWFVWTNTTEVVLSVFILWYSSLEVERSFLVVIAMLSSIFEILALLLFSRSAMPVIPAGPFALVFAIVYQSNRLVPSLYTFELFHPRILLNNRYPLYVLSLLLLTSQPPASTILGLCGILASSIFSSTLLPLWVRKWVIPTRVYETLGKALSPLMGQNRPFRRSNIVTYQEALLESLGGVAAEELFGTGTGAGTGGTGLAVGGGNAIRRRSAVQLDRPTSSQSPRVDDAPPAPPPPTGPRAATRLPPITGASFLSQWQAGLSGGMNQPSREQIAELTAIFPHASRAEIVQALQENELNVMRGDPSPSLFHSHNPVLTLRLARLITAAEALVAR